MPTFEVGSRKHIKKRVQGTYYVCVCTPTKRARVKPTSRAYSDGDPGVVRPTATAAAVLLLEKLCCRCRTSVVPVVPATTKLSLLGRTCQVQIFRLQISRISKSKPTQDIIEYMYKGFKGYIDTPSVQRR